MRRIPALAVILAAAAALGASDPLVAPVPLAGPAAQGPSPGDAAVGLAAALRAQSLGFPSTAVAAYRGLLAQPGADAPRVSLALAAALLDDGDVAGAGKVLDAYPGPRGASWHLRQGLVLAHQQRTDAARAEVSQVKAEDLEPAERGWFLFLQGMLADASADPVRAASLYQQAASAAPGELERARFVLAAEQVRLRSSPVTDAQLDADRKNASAYQGQKIGYGFTREYAIALDSTGRKAQAIDVLQAGLRQLPPEEKAEADHFRLLLGIVAGAGEGPGRHALFELLSSGVDGDLQRAALQMLVRTSQAGPQRSELSEALDHLIGAKAAHPVLESLLLCRAQLELGDASSGTRDSAPLYARAEADVRALLERFPGSSLKAQAYAVLAGSAWEQQRYRTAADYAFRAGAEFPPGPVRSQFDVLVAESWFRAGLRGKAAGDRSDFRSAADAYAVALRSHPLGVRPAVLMFQRVQSEIEAGDLPAASATLDELSRDPSFDAEERWKAEWNLARSLEAAGRTLDAYNRVTRVVQAGVPSGLAPELRARMAWLEARLSLDAKRPEETIRLADSLGDLKKGLPQDLETEISSSAELLRARAQFALSRDADALATLARLRSAYPRTESAVYSYIDEADRLSQQDKVVDAQRLLTKLADENPDSAFAPYALYQAALQAERLGSDKNLAEAYRLLEGLVTNPKYASSELIFPARMRQGDLLRELNQFPQAQQVYESLVNSPTLGSRADKILAELALAECHNAQSANNPLHASSALRILEGLVDRVDAPADVRVEAGYNLGVILSRTDAGKAQAAWWTYVVDPFLVQASGAQRLGPKGRWWVARTLLDSGLLFERSGRPEEAKKAWQLWVDSGLPGDATAREHLARFALPASKP
jgi:cellulose synthase operon protein C